jgi:Ca2+-binding RTX toxin-like protein
MTALRAALVAVAVLAVPASAHAGTASSNGTLITYVSTEADESVNVGTDGIGPFVTTDRTLTAAGNCIPAGADRAECMGTAFRVELFGGESSADGRQVTNAATLTVVGSAGNEEITGTNNADVLSGNAGSDTMNGDDGNDTLDGGPGENFIDDGAGNDVIIGGPQNDSWTAGPGTDVFTPGAGSDLVSFGDRTNGVTITLRGGADDGEAGEGDDAGTDAENATGGAGNDTIVANDLGTELRGGAGNDSIIGGAAEDRLVGQEGDDTIDARDGRYDSIDCGSGNDVVFADPTDDTTGCEVAPDVDGDRSLPPADCAPNDPAIHPGAGEIVGNAVDEDCTGGPQYLRVVSPIGYGIAKRGTSVRFTRLVVTELRAGDRIEVRCTTKKKGCPFSRKTVTVRAGRNSANLRSMFKKRFLKRGAVVEIRVLRANEIGRVQRLTVARGKFTSRLLCMNVGATSPTRCA